MDFVDGMVHSTTVHSTEVEVGASYLPVDLSTSDRRRPAEMGTMGTDHLSRRGRA